MEFSTLLTYLEKTYDQYPETDARRANRLTRRMKNLYPETVEPALKMNKALYSCAVDLVLGGMNPENFYEDGTRKAFKQIVVSHKGDPLRYDVVYEDSPFYPFALFRLPND